MGCAGSKPHLNNHSINHANSPQKGFIIFNSKTIDYIKANENELKQKIKEKCEQKLFSNRTLKSKVKKNLNKQISEQTTPTHNGDTQTAAVAAAATDNNQSIVNSSILCHEKEAATLDLAIDLVLKYVMNDFDIENFKSNSNHLSLKQIRKDILKKYSTIPNESTTTTSKTSTLSKGQSLSTDNSFYKKALTTAIDEFGTVIQEQFIAINEFKSLNEEKKPVDATTIETNSTPVVVNEIVIIKDGEKSDKEDIPIVDDNEEPDAERLLTLKEAMEQARQNFYRGKMSMICMTKSGSYILRDVKDDNENAQKDDHDKNEPVTNKEANENKKEEENEPLTPILKPKTVTMFDTETKKTSKIAIAPQITIEDADISSKFKIIETSLDEENAKLINDEACKTPNRVECVVEEPIIVSDRGFNKLIQEQMELRDLISNTTDASLNYSKNFMNSSKDDKLKYANELNGELAKVKTIVLTLKDLSENESDDNLRQINGIFLKSIIDFNKANRSLVPFIDSLSKAEKVNNDDYDLKIINHEIKTNTNEINEIIKDLPDKLFILNDLPTPNDLLEDGIGTTTTTTTTIKTTTTTLVDDKNEKTKVDVKKEITISILNVGEVLAKTIDHYTIEEPITQQDNGQKQTVKLEESVNNLTDIEKIEAATISITQEILSPPPPPSPSLQVSTPVSISSIDVDKIVIIESIDPQDSQQQNVQELEQLEHDNQQQQQEQNQNEQTHNDSTSFSSPSDLLSSLSSSSVMSSPNKNDNINSTTNTDNNKIENDTIEDNMAFLMREMENKISAHLDFYADSITQKLVNNNNTVNTVEVKQVKTEKTNGHSTVKEYVSTVIETATNKIDDKINNKKTNGVSTHHNNKQNGKRLSIDEELLNHINEVDRKVKYLTETCSEDDDDDYGINGDDNDKLFQPTKSNHIDLNDNEMHEELKQISNVIQGLVQSIQNDDNKTTTTTTIINDDTTNTGGEIEIKSTNGKVSDRKSISSIGGGGGGNSSFSSIPIRKVLIKQKATIDDENVKNIESITTEITTNDSFNDSNFTSNSARNSLEPITTPDIMNTSNTGSGKKKYKSKLPVKK